MLGIWPVALAAGVSFAVVQFAVSNYHGPWLVDVAASLASMAAVLLTLRVWSPKSIWPANRDLEVAADLQAAENGAASRPLRRSEVGGHLGTWARARPKTRRAWMPWLILSILVFLWGLPQVKSFLDHIASFLWKVGGLHGRVQRMPPVVLRPVAEPAIFVGNFLSGTGTGILAAALISGLLMGFSPARIARVYGATVFKIRNSLLTIAAMLALGTVTR